jgi:uncharacterized protein
MRMESSSQGRDVTRRTMLGTTLALAAGRLAHGQATQPAEESQPLPVNPLGKTGVKITRLGMGASFPEYGRRLLEFAARSGVRYFDNAENYVGGRAEGLLGDWLARTGHARDELFIVTKRHARSPDGVYEKVRAALERLGIDTIDLFFIHGIDDPQIPLDRDGRWGRLKDRLVREKRIRFMGFSTHAEMSRRAVCLENAPRGGWVDALMVACDPGLIAAHEAFNRALDRCAEAGVGLVAMKTTRGLGRAARQPGTAIEKFKQLGLTPHQAMQAGIWSDGRFASVCSEMTSFHIIEENTAGARVFRGPFDADQRKILLEGINQLSRATCPGCDGACRRAAGAETDFCSIARYLSYYEQDGNRDLARRLYAELPPERRSWHGADLSAASRACHVHLDFESLLTRAERELG